jgi:hypothetical protein
MDPYERANITSDQYNDWMVKTISIPMSRAKTSGAVHGDAQRASTGQAPGSFNIDPDAILKMLAAPTATSGKGLKRAEATPHRRHPPSSRPHRLKRSRASPGQVRRAVLASVERHFDSQIESSLRFRLLPAPAISLANRFARPAGRIHGTPLLLSRPPT